MAGIYLHIPFCKQACHYCNFHFSTLLKNKGELVAALLTEIRLQRDFFSEGPAPGAAQESIIETIYFGGGTPSLLSGEEIAGLLDRIRQYFPVAADSEITLEANPDDINPAKATEWRQLGINRLSIGVQSFFDEDLVWMNRSHDARRVEQCIEEIRRAGFDNFSADLIFGMPTLPDPHWEENIARMLAAAVPHLSCYALTVEPKTPLDYFIRQKKYRPPDEEQAARQFKVLMERLASAGYEHYEISNFARPGKHSRHNSNYWRGVPYLGIGPSAHSFTGETRQWNIANNALYLKNIAENKIPFQKEVLTPDMQLNEYLMTSLRTMEGCDLNFVAARWGEAEGERLMAAGEKYRRTGQIILRDNHLILSREGKLFADGIAAELFRVDAPPRG